MPDEAGSKAVAIWIQRGACLVGGARGQSTYAVRRILGVRGQGKKARVYYADYSRGDGECFGFGQCLASTLLRWAVRQATPEEIAELHGEGEAEIHELERLEQILRTVPDQMLAAEVERRGWKVMP